MKNKIIHRAGNAGSGCIVFSIGYKHIGFKFEEYADVYFVRKEEAVVIKPHKSIFDNLIDYKLDLNKRNIHVITVSKCISGYKFHLNDERFGTVVGCADKYNILIDNEHQAIIIKYGA